MSNLSETELLLLLSIVPAFLIFMTFNVLVSVITNSKDKVSDIIGKIINSLLLILKMPFMVVSALIEFASISEKYRFIVVVLLSIVFSYVFSLFNTRQEVSNILYGLQIILIGIVAFSSLSMQASLIEDGSVDRVVITFTFSLIFILGAVAHGIISILDENNADSLADISGNIGKIILLSILLNLKSFFSAISIGIGTILSIYYLLNYNENIETSFIMDAVKWLFNGFPLWVTTLYSVVMTLYLFLSILIED